MGVPLLLTWLRRRFANCFFPAEGEYSEMVRGTVDNLFIDLNSLLYQSSTIMSARRGHYHSVEEAEDAVLRKLFDLLDDIIFKLVQPTALVYVAVDGVSPLGKMSQQRSRRHRTSQRQQQHHHQHQPPAASLRRGPGADDEGRRAAGFDDFWDNNSITVGTRFMAKATEALHAYAVSRTERMNIARLHALAEAPLEAGETECPVLTPLAIVIDDVLRPGEGENKILEIVRRFRDQPGYNANLTHVVCSSDTDVTVSSLLLHEPRMYVLRYEPPPALGGKDPAFSAARGGGRGRGRGFGPRGAAPPAAADSWLSTFFSIYLFREGLRDILGLGPQPSLDTPAEQAAGETAMAELTAEQSAAFELALHDVVFVMLLFGNDFLPTLGGSIQEGTLDALLSLLSSDFVSRRTTVVDPATNQIQFTAARYLLDCLADIRGGGPRGGRGSDNNGNNSSSSLTVHTGDGSAGGGESDWGFSEDPAFQRRQAERERRLEKKCYCYWTMLQWALQYSAGVVEHWGCYYPFSDAPPLQALRKYCGVLSYDALVTYVASRHAARHAGQDAEEADLPSVNEQTVAAASAGTSGRRARAVGQPTDAMVQLLVLIPESSALLLPTVLRSAYDEIAAAVRAPVEELDIAFVERWCAEKKSLFSEEERTRFTAYHLFAGVDPLVPVTDEPALPCADPMSNVVEGDTQPAQEVLAALDVKRSLPANETTFIAYWNDEELRREVAEVYRVAQEKAAIAEKAKKAAAELAAAAAESAAAAALKPAVSVSVGLSARSVVAFFSPGRKPKQSAAITAAAAAVLQPTTPPPPPPPPPPAMEQAPEEPSTPEEPPVSAEDTNAVVQSAPTAEAAPQTQAPDAEAADTATAPAAREVTPAIALVTNASHSIYFFAGAPQVYLPSESLVRSLGYVDGPRFVIGSSAATAASADSFAARAVPALSWSPVSCRVRLQWSLAVTAPAETSPLVDAAAAARAARTALLPGYTPPVSGTVRSVKDLVAGKRAEEAQHPHATDTDVWEAIDRDSKRVRTEQ